MARLATSAVQLCQRLQELYPQKLQFPNKQSEPTSPFRRWTTGSGSGSSYRHHDHRNMYNKQMSEGSPQSAAGGGGGVARWSLGLEQLLADPAGAAAFAHFLAKEFAAENIRFWWSCEQYRCEHEDRRQELANEIWQRHLAEGAAEPVNVDAAARRATAARLHQQPPPQDLFVQTQKQIFNVMKFDSYPRFLRSGVHAECARADLRGLPPPYAPAPATAAADTEDSPGKLKKTASNASERRRSGGASLLPWKARAASRERPADTEDPPAPPLTDVVKSSQSSNGQRALCRVVLPDGATSVVGVDPAVTVGKLVDRLLQRRNLLCTTYDVILKDADQGECGAVAVEAPSVVLGGRCAGVERRALVRLQLGGRVLAVRARPARRLRHVLPPVLAACGVRDANVLRAARVTHATRTLHPDTLLQDLDGARLVISLPESNEEERDDDIDSQTDLALAHDDEESSARSVCSVSSFAPEPPSPGAGEPGRVRAALRPGPPLHHHPPDFLENLRETQRQRLPPRTPPPLPPKPARA